MSFERLLISPTVSGMSVSLFNWRLRSLSCLSWPICGGRV